MLLVLLTAFSLCAQGRYTVKGLVVDKSAGDVVVGATVRLLSLPDSSFVSGAVADEVGSFHFDKVNRGKYAVKFSFIGFMTKYVDVDLASAKTRIVDLGAVMLEDDAHMLKEAVVTANAAKVQVSGDSLVYSASAYRVPEGSTLEALVKLLPGAKVDDDGNITLNGKPVKKILVDGKEFFLNDVSAAMKNLPIDMIDKIKSYERKSDLARITGIDDGEEETVLDLSVKEGMKHGWYGNVSLGLGSNDLYNERGTVNRFNDYSKVTLMGNARNTPNRWGWNNGLRNNKSIGANFSTTRAKLETEGSVRYNYDGSNVLNVSSSENFAAQRGAFGESRNQSFTSNANVNANVKFEWKPDTTLNIIFRPNVSYSRNRSMGNNRSGSYDSDPNEWTDHALDYNDEIASLEVSPSTSIADDVLNHLMEVVVNTNTSRNQSYNRNVNANGELQVNRRFNNKGRNLTLRLTGGYGDGDSKQISAANITYNSLGTSRQNNRYYKTPSLNKNYSVQVTYNEPIAERTYLQMSYRYYHGYSRNDCRAMVYDSDAYEQLAQSIKFNRYDIDAILQFMDKMGYELRDTLSLCRFSEYVNDNHTASLQVRRVREHYNASLGLDAFPQHTELNYRYMGKEFPRVTRSVLNVAPRMYFRWNFDRHTNFTLRYNGRTSHPSMINLLDITDDSNPLYISKGNPNLKPSFSNNINTNFNTYNVDAQRGIWAWGNFSATSNSISDKTTYDKQTGVRTTMPMNIDGNWNMNGGIGMNTGLGEKKLFTFGANVGGRFSHNVGFYNNSTTMDGEGTAVRSITKNSGLNGGLNSTFRNDNFNVEVRGGITGLTSRTM